MLPQIPTKLCSLSQGHLVAIAWLQDPTAQKSYGTRIALLCDCKWTDQLDKSIAAVEHSLSLGQKLISCCHFTEPGEGVSAQRQEASTSSSKEI